jgi:hypothetical protein
MQPNEHLAPDDVPSLANFFCKGSILRDLDQQLSAEIVSYLPYPLPDDIYMRLKRSYKLTPHVLRAFAASQTKVSLAELGEEATDEHLDALLEFGAITYVSQYVMATTRSSTKSF